MGKPLRVFVREGMRAQGTREIAARQGREHGVWECPYHRI